MHIQFIKTKQGCTAFALSCLLAIPILYIIQTNPYSIKNRSSAPHYIQEIQYKIQQCQPKNNIYFLKVHKTGGTTVRNILQRYIYTHNLTTPVFVGHHAYPASAFTEYLVPLNTYWKMFQKYGPKNWHHPVERSEQIRENHCNVVDVHSVYNKAEVLKLFDQDVAFLATVRHPLGQLASSFNMWNLANRFGLSGYSDPVKEFLKHPAIYDRKLDASLYPNTVHQMLQNSNNGKISYTQNRMAFEFGFVLKHLDDNDYIYQYLTEINETFKVVIIAEHFVESLLLMKEELCWPTKDIMYIALRNSTYMFKRQSFTQDTLKKHKRWTRIDYRLYDMFLERHMHIISQKGSSFIAKVQLFQHLQDQVVTYCNDVCNYIRHYGLRNNSPLSHHFKNYKVNKTRWNEAFEVDPEDCVAMTTEENLFFDILQVKQHPSLCNKAFAQQLHHSFGLRIVDPRACTRNTFKYNIPKYPNRICWTLN